MTCWGCECDEVSAAQTSADPLRSLSSFDAAPGANAPGAQSGLDALSSLPAIPTQNPSVFSPPSHSAQTVNGSGGGDLLDLL